MKMFEGPIVKGNAGESLDWQAVERVLRTVSD